jgi:hypothetical protein
MNYNKVNNYTCWLAFFIALLTYTLTLEPSVSFWDCGEFIACIYRLQVAHQPGAPLFTMIGKVITLLSLGDNTKVAYWANMTSAIASAATILFLFWTITALAKKILIKKAEDLTLANLIAIMGAGMVGALAYTYSDSFWFSAVESEVYAQSSLCTAIVFWAILKWDAHADEPNADKWIIFIAYVMGLSIGIHLLNLLVIPPIALIIYFRRSKNVTTLGSIGAFLLGCVVLGAILWGIIQFSVKGAAFADLFFVNTLGLGFGSGAITFFLLLFAAIVAGIYYSISQKRFVLNMALICTAFIFFGYSSFVMIVIRAKAGTNLNNSDPRDAFSLNSYLNRDQYGETPLLYGNYYDAKVIDQTQGANIYRKGKTKYEVVGRKISGVYDHNTVFPRMFSQQPGDPEFYKGWSQLGDNRSPTFADNLGFFFTWQINQMYTRYFLWNFAGRANEMDGQLSSKGIDGSWISGWNFGKILPASVTQSKSYNRLYFLPFILGLLGAIYHFRRSQQDAGVVGVLFFFTGLAIVLYLNQDPLQPRERDYAYTGSFYAFAIWIGLGVLFVAEQLTKKEKSKNAAILATVVCLSLVPVLMAGQEWDDHDRSTKLTAHDMAYNYLNSCAPNAILFTYADNDTYPIWYLQEVENVRPDVRIINLSLLGTDWYIRQMKTKMNQSEPAPITMPDEKFKMGVRDMIYYNDAKIPGMEVKNLFDYITSDKKTDMVQYQNGDMANYLPTKNLAIRVNADDVVKTGTIPADKKAQVDSLMTFVYPSDYVTKENLALLDIMAHNDWKRPIYFSLTVPTDNMLGMERYMYNEGFAYRLLPLKVDTALRPLEADNTQLMYNNVMSKFKWGNMKHANYLDHESLTVFYPLISTMFLNLTQNLIRENHPDLAKNVLEKYDEVMPATVPVADIAIRKYYMVASAYSVNDIALANKIAGQLYSYLTNSVYYNYTLFAAGKTDLNNRDIQLGMSMLNGLAGLTKQYNQPALSNKFAGQIKDYEVKFGVSKK